MSTPKRARGEGTVYYDKARDRWVGAVTLGGRRRKVTGKDKTEARARLAELLAAKANGVRVPNKRTTVSQVLDSFLERGLPNRTSNGRPLAPKTVEQHHWAADHARRELGTIAVVELGPQDIEAMMDRLARTTRSQRGLGRSSLSRIRLTLSMALDFAERRGEVIGNVAKTAEITPSAARTKVRRSLSPVEARALLQHLRSERNGLMFGLSLRLGLRPGEAAALYWEDLEGETLNITRGVRVEGSSPSVSDDLKTEGSKRTIGLPSDLVEWFSAHRAEQNLERIAADRWADDRLVFPTRTGTVQLPRNTRRQFRAITERAQVTQVAPNELRHSCASLLADEGVPNEAIADLLGHTTTRMVDRTYRHRIRPVVDVALSSTWAQDS